jgi:hypothetical protein
MPVMSVVSTEPSSGYAFTLKEVPSALMSISDVLTIKGVWDPFLH